MAVIKLFSLLVALLASACLAMADSAEPGSSPPADCGSNCCNSGFRCCKSPSGEGRCQSRFVFRHCTISTACCSDPNNPCAPESPSPEPPAPDLPLPEDDPSDDSDASASAAAAAARCRRRTASARRIAAPPGLDCVCGKCQVFLGFPVLCAAESGTCCGDPENPCATDV
eukprot:jgi/Ulvmu1/12080/UM084_0002.1